MRWPWVSRETLEMYARERGKLLEDVARLTRELAAERQRYADLVGTIVEMKREGFMPPVRPEMLEPSQPELPDAILLAIGRRAMPKTDLERELLRWATAEMRQQGADPDAIARKILRGASDYEEE
jgi:hypothetical protein